MFGLGSFLDDSPSLFLKILKLHSGNLAQMALSNMLLLVQNTCDITLMTLLMNRLTQEVIKVCNTVMYVP